MGKIFFSVVLVFMLVHVGESHAVLCRDPNIQRATFPEEVPGFGENSCPVTENTSSREEVILQVFEVTGITLKEFKARYSEALRNSGWTDVAEKTSSLPHETITSLSAVHPKGYRLDLVLNNVGRLSAIGVFVEGADPDEIKEKVTLTKGLFVKVVLERKL